MDENCEKTAVDEFIDTINTSNIISNMVPESYPITEPEVGSFVIDQATKIIKNTADTIELLNSQVSPTSDPESIEALSELVKAVATTLEVVNKINLQNKKLKTAKELKQMDIDHKKALPQANITNNTLIMGTREEIFKKLAEIRQQQIEIVEIPTADEETSNVDADSIVDVNPTAGLEVRNDI